MLVLRTRASAAPTGPIYLILKANAH